MENEYTAFNLTDPEYVDQTNKLIENWLSTHKDNPPDLKWELLKLAIIKNTQEWSEQKARARHAEFCQLRAELDKLTKELDKKFLDQLQQQIDSTQSRIHEFVETKAKGKIFRSKIR